VEDNIERGTRVQLKIEPFREGRPHLLQHARQRDIGTVADAGRAPAMARLYVIVYFEVCWQSHRVHEHETIVVD